MQGSIHLGRIAGISIDLHFTWFIIFALVALGISTTVLPRAIPDLEPAARWVLGIGMTIVFFISLLLHELAHSLVAKRLGIGISGITLFVFGGVSRMTSEPKSANDELKVAAAGPLTSALLGVMFLALWFAAKGAAGHDPIQFSLFWLGVINFFLAGFNLVPGFPLDGGRLLRAIIWSATNDLRHATYIAATAGQGFGYLLIGGGVLQILVSIQVLGGQGWENGLWPIFIGWFLLDAARSSYQQQVLQSALSGVRVRDIMTPNVITIPPDLTLQQAVDDYFLRLNHAAFPVADAASILGILTLPHVRRIPRDRWAYTRAADVVEPLQGNDVMRPDADAWEALSTIAGKDSGRLLVADGDELVGIISRTDVMRFLRTKMELGM
ncbi:MAG: site-2 protease family protein [Armatimonadota bacterium]|nr:MAG: site-2 protease family protein [Armatimonadota bacterium]